MNINLFGGMSGVPLNGQTSLSISFMHRVGAMMGKIAERKYYGENKYLKIKHADH